MAQEELDRLVLVQELDPERVDDYLEAHEDVPSRVVEVMEETGVREFRLFVGEELSIGYIVAEDIERFQEVYNEEPECLAWEERVANFKRSGVDPETGEFPMLEEAWTFSTE